MGDVLTPMRLADVLAGLNINTGGGAYAEGDASAGGDFIGRDKVVNVFVFPSLNCASCLNSSKKNVQRVQ